MIKENMKRVIAIIILSILSVTFCGCDKHEDTSVMPIIMGGKIYPIVIVGE